MHFLLAQNNIFTDNRLVRRGKLVHMSLLNAVVSTCPTGTRLWGYVVKVSIIVCFFSYSSLIRVEEISRSGCQTGDMIPY